MNSIIKRVLFAAAAGALILAVFAGCSLSGKTETSPEVSLSPSPSESAAPTPSPTPSVTKDDIQKALDGAGDSVIDVTWSPDDTMVAFIKDENGAGNIYVWKVGSAEAALVSAAEGTTDGFSWSPDSKHFLINVGHMGPGTITSSLIAAETLKVLATDITTVSLSPPVWSSDGRFIALSTDDEASGNIEIRIYAVTSRTSVSVLQSNNKYGPYVVEKWDNDTVTYSEISSTGERAELTLQFGE